MTDNHNHISINMADIRAPANGKVLNGNMYNGVPSSDIDCDKECCSGMYIYRFNRISEH